MILPNKLFSYNDSILSKIPYILNALKNPMSPSDLLHVCPTINSPVELIDILDCLYALKKIKLNDKEKIEKC